MGLTITKEGKIYKGEKELKGWNQSGYRMVCINYKKIYVHILVAEQFIPNPNNFNCVNHRNGIKNDNRVENLEWTIKRDNCEHARLNGLSENKSRGIKNITFDEYLKICELRDNGLSYRKIATIMNLNYRRIMDIYKGKRYKDYKQRKEVNLV